MASLGLSEREQAGCRQLLELLETEELLALTDTVTNRLVHPENRQGSRGPRRSTVPPAAAFPAQPPQRLCLARGRCVAAAGGVLTALGSCGEARTCVWLGCRCGEPLPAAAGARSAAGRWLWPRNWRLLVFVAGFQISSTCFCLLGILSPAPWVGFERCCGPAVPCWCSKTC